jgi:hypothetical protein
MALGTILLEKLRTANTNSSPTREDQIIEIRFQIIVLLLDPKPLDIDMTSMDESGEAGTGSFRTNFLSDCLPKLVPYVFGSPPAKKKGESSATKLIAKGQEEKLRAILSSGLLLPGFGKMYTDYAVNFEDAPLINFFAPSPLVEHL